MSLGEMDEANSRLLNEAFDKGINFFDTADLYQKGLNEATVGKALKEKRKELVIATKVGNQWREDGIAWDWNPTKAYIFSAVEKSLQRLKIETIDLYYAHRVDKNVPNEETVGAMADLVKQGKVRYLGLSEASAASIRKAHAVHPIAALQSEYSLLTRDVEGDILDTIRELGITLIPYSPLARGIITATVNAKEDLAADDFRRTLPRFDDEHVKNNVQLVNEFAAIAKSKNATPAQLALAWVLAQGEDIIPIPGTKKRKYLEENAKAVDITLSKAELAAIESLLDKYPDIGQRYSQSALSLVNQ